MTRFARRAERVQPSAIREFLALAGQPGITSFAGGYPDPTLFPIEQLHKIYDDLLTPANASALQYTARTARPSCEPSLRGDSPRTVCRAPPTTCSSPKVVSKVSTWWQNSSSMPAT